MDRLERQGVAERVRHPHDRRRTLVRLTERGQHIATESQGCLARALQQLAGEELASFASGLAVVADHLDAVASGMTAGEIDPIPTHALPAA